MFMKPATPPAIARILPRIFYGRTGYRLWYSFLAAAVIFVVLQLSGQYAILFLGLGALSFSFVLAALNIAATGPETNSLAPKLRQRTISTYEVLSRFFRRADCDSDYASAIEELPIALVKLSADGTVLHANAQSRDLLHLEVDEAPHFSDLVGGLGRAVGDWLESAKQKRGTEPKQMLSAKRSGGSNFLQVTLASVQVQGEDEFIAILTDATEFKSLEKQFVQSQKMQAIGQLAGGVAHDFNNILTAISGYCDLLMLRHERGDPDYADLAQISSNANRAAALVGQLLAFSRKQTLQLQSVQVNNTLSDMIHLLDRLVGERIRLNFERGKDLPPAFVDGRQLEQVIMNLVLNARDAMPEGGEITVRTTECNVPADAKFDKAMVREGRYVDIQVQDNGTGIPKEIQNKIFEPFFSTKSVGEGTGLGLSTAYGIMKQSGGYIFVESAPDTGTLFRVLVPVAEDIGHANDALGAKTEKEKSALSGRIILMAEDEDSVRTFAAQALRMQGVNLLDANSADEALILARQHNQKIDAIISDVVMPGMDGPTWVRKAREFCPDAPVIFVSGYAEDSFDHKSKDIGNFVFLPKPFSLKELIDEVGTVLK